MWYVYLLYSEKVKKHYIGSTNDINRRLKEHLSGRSKFTSMAKDWKLVHYVLLETEHDARAREALIKYNKQLREEFYEASKQSI